jgi:transmembrane sensor
VIAEIDTGSELRASRWARHKEVRLVQGQALFSVQSNPSMPFVVKAPGVTVQVLGTRFSVRHTKQGLFADHTVVAVEEGVVEVISATSAQRLAAGEMVVVSLAGEMQWSQGQRLPDLLAWRSGRVVFNQGTLGQVLDEFSRYGPVNVALDARIQQLKVGGTFHIDQAEQFLQSLPALLPVAIVTEQGQRKIMPRAD